jgi:hypothetical protein
MKNIHVIPTSSPSKIFYIAENFHLEKGQLIEPKSYHNVYITSDEEIKVDGDWYYNTVTNAIFQMKYLTEYNPEQDKKIILTTDQDLIKDGVQSIDDKFLEWFIKNPSCEIVEIKPKLSYIDGKYIDSLKIIIPQEEPKQEPCDNCNNDVCCCIIRTQETLEEAAFRLYPRLINDPYNPMEDDNKENRDIWIAGAKWQAEQDKNKWSNEEVKDFLAKFHIATDGTKKFEDEWFEQFKKK